jgi:hypothetical protein
LFGETKGKLLSLERAVAQGRAVDEASNFSRWLFFSGLCELLESASGIPPWNIDGKEVRVIAERVTYACGLIYKGGKQPVNPQQSTVDEINAKVDYLLSKLAKPAPPLSVQVLVASPPPVQENQPQAGSACQVTHRNH